MTGIQQGKLEISFARVDIGFGKLIFHDLITGLIDLRHVTRQYRKIKVEPFQLILGGDILFLGRAVIDYNLRVLEIGKK